MTAPMLESYVAGRWFAATDEATPVADAVTGETVARVSSTGLDVAAMLDHARTVGGPALRELTFHQRAGAAQAAGAAADGARRTSSTRSRTAPARPTGTTRSTSTAASARCSSYACKARRELPDDTI